MNPAQPTRATVKASRLPLRLRRRFGFTSSVGVPPLLTWFEVIGYTVLLEPDIVSGKHGVERSSYGEVVLPYRLYSALRRINPTISFEAIAAVISQVTYTESALLLENNRLFHQLLIEGVDIEDNQTGHNKVWLIDSSNLLNNDWLAISPFTIVHTSHTHSPDVVIFINGLPLAVIVSIDPISEKVSLKAAHQRLQSYFQQIPSLFSYNAFLIICCGNRARVGTLTSLAAEFLPWRTIDGEDFPSEGSTELEVLIQGIFDKRRFLYLVKHFIVFEQNGANISKKLLRYPFCTKRGGKE